MTRGSDMREPVQSQPQAAVQAAALPRTWYNTNDGERQAQHENCAEEALPAQQLVRVQVHVAQQKLLQNHLPRRCTVGMKWHVSNMIRAMQPLIRISYFSW